MALSSRTKDIIEVALADRKAATELSSAVDAGGNTQAAFVANLSVAAVTTTDGSGGAGDAALATSVDSRFDDVETKVNAILTALKNAGLMATS
jgi:hypothetical protein